MSTPSAPITALVPARGGSRRIKRKNLVNLAGKPLILHALDTLRQVPDIDRIVVCTEDTEIAAVVTSHGFEVTDRPVHLSDDRTTIDQLTVWWREQDPDSTLLVVQPTVPLITVDTLTRFVADSLLDESTTMVAPESTHILWREGAHDWGYSQEIGIRLYPPGCSGRPTDTWTMPLGEAFDIDTVFDLAAAQQQFARQNVVFEFIAGGPVGSGHLHRTLTLAEQLQHHNVHLVYRGGEKWVQDLLSQRSWTWSFSGHEASYLEDEQPGVWVMDTLDTQTEDVTDRLAAGWKVVTLEDHGLGSRYTSFTINALYPPADHYWDRHPHRHLWGSEYAVLRPEFLSLPKREVRSSPERILVTFGGTDPQRFTERVGGLLKESFPGLYVRVVPPPGRAHQPQPLSMAAEFLAADVAITSAGRTVYEAAACGTPAIVLAQNMKEATHVHLNRWGNLYKGIGGFVSDDEIVRAVKHLLDDAQLRASMAAEGQRSVDGRGARRIVRKIEDLLEGL